MFLCLILTYDVKFVIRLNLLHLLFGILISHPFLFNFSMCKLDGYGGKPKFYQLLIYIGYLPFTMTRAERERPEQLLNASRKKRIAAGSGTTVEEVNRLLKQFEQIKKLMKQFSDMGRMGGKKNRGGFGKMKLPF